MTTLLGLLLAALPAVKADTTFEAPDSYVRGAAFPVKVVVRNAGAEATTVPARILGPGALAVNGEPLPSGESTAEVVVPPGGTLTAAFDLAPHLAVDGPFRLGLVDGEAREIAAYAAAPDEDFLQMEPDRLDDFRVILRTNHGDMVVALWPDVAPNHARNFLDLAASGFYDGTLFHRVSPTFMIQGGDPKTREPNTAAWGSGGGPRRLQAEFNDRHHERGVLSMARSQDPNSASSQFFIVTGNAGFLDGEYTAFGKLVAGYETLDAIASAPGTPNPDRTVRPTAPQRIDGALVVVPIGATWGEQPPAKAEESKEEEGR